MKVLVADNNAQMLSSLCDLLEKDGFETLRAESGQDALKTFQTQSPDFVCLDIMMPDLSGYDVCKEIRRVNISIPIIFISSKSETVDKIVGLEIGADDYIVKPFDIQEVVARIRAIARRCLAQQNSAPKKDDTFRLRDVVVYPNMLRAEKSGKTIELSLRDIKILKLLHDRKDQVIDRDVLLDYCWGAHIMPESRTVDWHVSQLRKKVEDDPKNPTIIQTVHGVGYKFSET